ncbi:MAG: AAA family ATPase [Candidatus Methanomethylophilaceae archaeon]|nr:AAA family ATPase [Candidatus Methanomethylophilaceae archaeon]MBR7123585.1 AAA family ATPase [Candidatus Methanomethylophilaceae archaeon]
MIIAFAGKGGVGKSTISSQLIRNLARKSLVLAVDADPNSNLGEKLGIESFGTIGGIRNGLVADPDQVPSSVSKQDYILTKVQQTVGEGDNVDLLVMGRPEGEGCYCFVNDILRNCFGDMIPKYRYTVIDNEAGMEHLSRKVLPRADVLVLVSDPTFTGVRTAARLSQLADEVGVKVGRRILVINNIPVDDYSSLIEEATRLGLDEVVPIKRDDNVIACAMRGEVVDVPDDSAFAKSVGHLAELIEK